MNNSLKIIQQQFMDYLLNANTSITKNVTDQQGLSADKRLEIYFNAYRIRLKETIDIDHPVLGIYLGDDLFDEMVENYIEQYPSTFNSLRQFCDQLPTFLQHQQPFSDHPQIAELARFERLLLSSFDAADASRQGSDLLSTIPAELWPTLKLQLHPSVQIFHSVYNSVEIWQSIKADKPPASAVEQNSAWVLWRNSDRVTEFMSLDSIDHSLLDGIVNGLTVDSLCEGLLVHLSQDHIPSTLVERLNTYLQQGLISRIIS